jgi:hypothetical protein
MSNFFRMIFFLFLLAGPLSALEFDNQFNRYPTKSKSGIKRFKICGERCTGTNYLHHLIGKNFPELSSTGKSEYGQKHFLWWIGTPIDFQKLKNLKYATDAVTFINSNDCLFVVIVRDPYDWLRSFSGSRFHVHQSLIGNDFFHFISLEWKASQPNGPLEGDCREIDNLNPYTQKPFSNLLELRKYKTQNYLALRGLVKNYLFVNYERVRDDPEGFVHFVANFYHLSQNPTFIPITTHKGSNIPYEEKEYFPLSEHEVDFINQQLDWTVEHSAGYTMRDQVD